MRALINYAIREYRKPDGSAIITDNPIEVVYQKWNPVKPRTSPIPDNKVGAVWSALNEWRDVAYNRDTLASIDLVMFLILTGARIGEASALTWDRVNLDERWWHIPDPKNSNPVWLPLSSQAHLTASLMWLFPKQLAQIFIKNNSTINQEVILIAIGFLKVAAIFQIADGAQVVGAGMLRGLRMTLNGR